MLRQTARPRITTRTRWLKRAAPPFEGRVRKHARKLATRTENAAPALVRELVAIRNDFAQSIARALGVEKAGDVHGLSTAHYLAAKHAIEAMTASAYADAIYDDATALLEVGYDAARDYLAVDTATFDVPPVWATQALQAHADDVGGLASAYDRVKMTSILDAALLSGDSARDTATAMRNAFDAGFEVTNEDGDVSRVMRSDAWFDMVARTELQRATNLGQYSLYEAAGVQKVTLQCAEPCDECAEADGVTVELGDAFPGVDQSCPPFHLRCRCVLIPSDADLGDFNGTDEEIATARRGGYASDDEAQAQRDKLSALADKQAARAAKRAAKE